jgi:hypothetical protein
MKLRFNRLANFFIRMIVGISLNDTTNAFKTILAQHVVQIRQSRTGEAFRRLSGAQQQRRRPAHFLLTSPRQNMWHIEKLLLFIAKTSVPRDLSPCRKHPLLWLKVPRSDQRLLFDLAFPFHHNSTADAFRYGTIRLVMLQGFFDTDTFSFWDFQFVSQRNLR